ncbi:MAG: M23 family metallopeptidase [Flavobacteriales bacterium]|nr:M23 family metallopeptidase [Flavobacteriales bacterium]|tara:strand:+ start:2272 stop:3105 length:834 start_codon:yes stop_codon:yes gene_type:complete
MVKNSKYYFFRRLTKKYRLAILNDGTFEERIVIKTTPLLVISIILVFGFLAVLSSFGIVASFNKGGNATKERQDIVENYRTIDSLKLRIERTDLYLEKVKIILGGGVIGDSSIDVKNVDIIEENINLEKTKNDDLFRIKMERKSSGDYISNSYNNIVYFFTPLSGTFTEKYDVNKNHFGIDIVSEEGSIINSIADGIVVINNWTKETGFVIGVQHSDGFLSFYKHNSKNLKNIGDYVKSGEGIAIIGSSGELSSGPHLHFELWKNGKSVNPENYIVF